jgi:protocatechuate 3,4-dioxygenase beta subunit
MRTAFIPRPTELGPGNPPPEDPSPDPSFDFFAKDFEELADQLGCPRSRPNLGAESRLSTAYEHRGYQEFIGLSAARETAPTPECPNPDAPTEDNIEGPYYRTGAPWTRDLANSDEPGRRLIVSGIAADRCGEPIEDAVLDIWQATENGHYDNDGSTPPPDPSEFRLRGRLKTGPRGEYQFLTVWPGPYSIGNNIWRPSHIHVKVRIEGYQELTTQLYFKGDPYNEGDFGYKPSLELNPIQENGHYAAAFYFVIEKRGSSTSTPSLILH